MKKIYYILTAVVLFLSTTMIANAQEKFILSFTTPATDELASIADTKVKPSSGTATSEQLSGEPGPIELSFDGDYNTFYHSQWGNTDRFPITLQYNFLDVEQIDYVVYVPRPSGSNGNFKELEVYYKVEGGTETLHGAYDFGGASSSSTIYFDAPLVNPEYIKFKVLSGVGDNNNIGFASCAEMEFYKINTFEGDMSAIFADEIFSELKPGVTSEDIHNSDMLVYFKRLAYDLLRGDYDIASRVREIEPYRPISELANELKISTYNSYENPTGIVFKEGEPVVIFVPTTSVGLSIISRNWRTELQESFNLKAGVNYIMPAMTGLTYVNFFSAQYKTLDPIQIHIRGGAINGVFKKGVSTNEDWKDMLKNAATEFIDLQGDYINLCYQLPGLKTYCPNDGERLIELHDEIVALQYEMMGFFKYDRVPKNHMYAYCTFKDALPSAGALGAFFPTGSVSQVCSPTNIVRGDNSWVIGHELGHVNQIRPDLKWVGLAEVTNNVYSSYVQYMLTSTYSTTYLRLEHESCRPIDGESSIVGGRFNSHLHYGVLKGDNWLFQWGQDGTSDHFVKLVPLWQLNLYYKIADYLKEKETGTGIDWGKPDWYADIAEMSILNTTTYTNGQHQINFIKRACETTETDLTDFFKKAGLLKPIDESIDDYGTQRLTITQAMCDEVDTYVAEKGWAKPVGEINYISGNTVHIYAGKLAVEGTKNTGVTVSGTNATVSHSSWKNAVVYETYAGDELIRITMAGTGSTTNASTRVPFPSTATKIVAVSWDGERHVAYEK